MNQALRESEDALIRLCERALRRGKSLLPLSRVPVHFEDRSPPHQETCFLKPTASPHGDPKPPIDMYKNQLQELAQRSCFSLPSYGCVREGPDHAPRFKGLVKFNNEVFEGPGFCSTLRQAEHAVAEVALQELSRRGPTQSLAARMLDETGVCKNLLQETAQKAGVPLPLYSSTRTGPGHLPVYICSVNVGGRKYVGQSAKTKKQAEKNAAATAWAMLKQAQNVADSESDEVAQNAVVKALLRGPEGGDSLPASTSAEEPPMLLEKLVLPREVPQRSRLFGGVSRGLGEYGQSASLRGELPGMEKAESAEVQKETSQVRVSETRVGGVSQPPALAPFNLFGAAPFREQQWISPATAKQAKAESPMALAPIVVPRTLQAVYGARQGDDDDDISDDESPTARVLKSCREKDERRE